jgi:hypothetical protein
MKMAAKFDSCQKIIFVIILSELMIFLIIIQDIVDKRIIGENKYSEDGPDARGLGSAPKRGSRRNWLKSNQPDH